MKNELNIEEVFEVDNYMYFYDDLTKEKTEEEANNIIELIGLEKDDNILDIPCGFGRHINYLASVGYKNLYGIEYMNKFLDIAKNDTENLNIKPHFEQGDMRNINFSNEFDKVLCLFTSFGYFEDDENEKVLKNFYNALKKGGIFIFDSFNIFNKIIDGGIDKDIVEEKDNNYMIERLHFDALNSRHYNNRLIIKDGKIKHKPFFVRVYTPTEIKRILKDIGFSKVNFYGNYEGEEFNTYSKRMVVVAKK